MNKNSEVARKMSYSIDLRKRVVDYVENGGRIAQAAGLFQVGRATIYRWPCRTDLRATKVKRRKKKLDQQALEKDVKENLGARLIDRAKKFGVKPSAISYALKKMKIIFDEYLPKWNYRAVPTIQQTLKLLNLYSLVIHNFRFLSS